jgi:large subunit ribosomal protein L17
MRHSISGRKLNRTSSHRKALFKNLSNSLIINEQIKTTLPKAKDLRSIVEKIITLGKNDNLHSKRKVFSLLRSNESVNKVFNILSKRYIKRNGGYTRVLKAGFRYGDSAPMAIIEFVERDINAKGLVDKERNKLKEQDSSKVVDEKKVEDKADDKKIKSKLTKEKTVKDSSKDKSEESKK